MAVLPMVVQELERGRFAVRPEIVEPLILVKNHTLPGCALFRNGRRSNDASDQIESLMVFAGFALVVRSAPLSSSTASLRAPSLEQSIAFRLASCRIPHCSHINFSSDHEPGPSGRFVPPRRADAARDARKLPLRAGSRREAVFYFFLLSIGATLAVRASCTSLKTGSFRIRWSFRRICIRVRHVTREFPFVSHSESWQRNHIWTAKPNGPSQARVSSRAGSAMELRQEWDPARENAESPGRSRCAGRRRNSGRRKPRRRRPPVTRKNPRRRLPRRIPKRIRPAMPTADEGRSTKDAQANRKQAPQWTGFATHDRGHSPSCLTSRQRIQAVAVSPAMDEGVALPPTAGSL